MSTWFGYGDAGADIHRLQVFLVRRGAAIATDGHFGLNTRSAVDDYQRGKGLMRTGTVDTATIDALELDGFVLLGPTANGASSDVGWPPRPATPPQPNATYTDGKFGRFNFTYSPIPGNPERIIIDAAWVSANIVTVDIPELDNMMVASDNTFVLSPRGRLRVHRLAEAPVKALFAAWKAAGLLDRIITHAGAYNPRLKRGATNPVRANLSNHSWGTAFDINIHQNMLGNVPALVGARGCVRELVAIANANAFFWGGHFTNRRDGMHFELT
jgi:hypothetical protein